MLYRLIRPLLFSLDAERAHGIGLAAARALAHRPGMARFVRRLARPAGQPVRVAGLSFPNPIGLAAGLDKNAEAAMAWWAVGFGFIELGTVTPCGQPGHPRPRLFRYPNRAALVNRMGFNNDGADAVARRLEEQAQHGRRPSFPIGLSIGKNMTTPPQEAAEDYARAAAILAPHADFLVMNVSSPNTRGLRDLQAASEVETILGAIGKAVHEVVPAGRPVFVKIAPEMDEATVGELVDACGSGGAAGIVATNTLSTEGADDLPEGGLSGRPLRELSRRRVAAVRRLAGSRLAVIGCGGIDDADSARAMLDAGADLIEIYTGLIYRGPFLPARITRRLETQKPVTVDTTN